MSDIMSESTRRIAGLLFILVLLCTPAAGQTPKAQKVSESIKHADTYYWFGMAEMGNMEAFRRGLEHLDEAEASLATAGLPEKAAAALRGEIDALRGDLENQADMAHDTLYGVFPLVRLLAPTLFVDAAATGTFELVDDPDVIATCAASEALSGTVIREWKSYPQLDVIFTSVPYNQALENEALYIFNNSSKFFVHSFREAAAALSPEDLKRFQGGELTPEIIRDLCRAFGIPRLLVVLVRELDIVDGDFFYLAEGHVFQVDREEASHHLFNMGFCRDRTAQLWPIVLSHILLLLLAVGAYPVLVRLRTYEWPSWKTSLPVPAVGFILGRTIPWILVPLVGSIAPPPETLAKLSFWWPCTAGAVLFLGPMVVYRIVSIRIQNIAPVFGMDGKGGAVFTGLSLGGCAYLAGPLFLLFEGSALAVLIPLTAAASVAGYLLGRTLDRTDPLPIHAGVLPVLATLAIGAGVCHGSGGFLWKTLVLLIVATAILISLRLLLRKTAGKAPPDTDGPTRPGQVPGDVQELALCAESPTYRELEAFRKARESAAGVLECRTTWLALSGPSGVGKTATARAVIRSLKQVFCKSDIETALLAGECPEEVGEGTPFAPFQKALARHFEIDLLAPPEAQIQHIDAALEGIFESVVPFSGLLFPPSGDSTNNPGSPKEVFLAVEKTLRTLAKKRAVILFIDDAHWMDSASRELLAFLLAAFPQGGNERLLILVTGRDSRDFEALEMEKSEVPVIPPGEKERADILISSLGIQRTVAQAIAKRIAGTGTQKGELFWLFHVVAHFARNGVFRRTDREFVLTEEFAGLNNLPYPEDFRSALEEELNRTPEFRTLLECAACLGFEFNVSVLSESLERPRLEILHILDRVEKETGLLVDVEERDDVYAFRSSFVLETIRGNIRISGKGPEAGNVPQVVREYHSRVAESLEKTLEKSSNALFEVAKHYFAAGTSRAEKALSFTLQASRAASDIFNYDQAREYLKMAAECSRVHHRGDDFEEESLLVDCSEAHVTGLHRRESAEKVLAYLEKKPGAATGFLIIAARTCYDAGADSGDQKYFAEAARLGSAVVKRAADDLEKAEGYHFVGISLPVSQRKAREENLRRSLALVDGSPEDDLHAQALRGRVANSLAEQLSYNKDESRMEARSLFELSIQIKSRPELRDLPGLARSYGGLGRFHLFSSPPDIPAARENFEKDLEVSGKIGDIAGQCKMYSFLAQCDFMEGDVEGAEERYRKSFEAAEGDVDRFFAGIGRMECLSTLKKTEGLDEAGGELLGLAKTGGVPRACSRRMLVVLEKCAEGSKAEWAGELVALARKAAES